MDEQQPDFKTLHKKFPNRSWETIYERMINGEPIASSLRMALERYTKPKDSNDEN